MRALVPAFIAAATLATTASWGTAIEVPGAAALDHGGSAGTNSVSCPTPGNCTAVGGFRIRALHAQPFVTTETDGVWGTAEKVPGVAGLNRGEASLSSISCPSAGFCAATGSYDDDAGDRQAFVANEVNGIWRKAIEVPGFKALNAPGGWGDVGQVSCSNAGFCAAGGIYWTATAPQAFLVSEKNGIWRKAIEVPGFAALNHGGGWVSSISCATPRSCVAGGTYIDGRSRDRAFLVTERHGVWGKAVGVPGMEALDTRALPGAEVDSVSCARAGWCAATGYYTDDARNVQAFVVNEVNGVWHKAIKVPGSGALNTGGYAEAYSVSCAAAGSCAAGGYYSDALVPGSLQSFVVTEVNGVWSKAIEVPGTAALNVGDGPHLPRAEVDTVSCAAPGSCAVGGRYTDDSGLIQPFVVNEAHGVWDDAVEVPGMSELNLYTDPHYGGAGVSSISCATATSCVAGGTYLDAGNLAHAFVTSP